MNPATSERTSACALICVLLGAPLSLALAEATGVAVNPVGLSRPEDFTYLWWADGPQHYLDMKGPPPTPVLCFLSGTLGFALDTKSLRVLHAGEFIRPFDRESALKDGPGALRTLPAGALAIHVRRGADVFRCVGRGRPSQDEFFFPVRFIESGRLFQRVTIEELQFADAAGEKLKASGRLELAFWPDRLICLLELDVQDAVVEGELTFAFGERTATALLKETRRLTLELLATPPRPAVIEAGNGARATWTPSLGAWMVQLPTGSWKNSQGTYYPQEELDRWDRWPISVRNESDQEAIAPVIFVPEPMRAITGFTAMLCDPDGTPTGVFVQHSKNWHSRKEKGDVPHQGQWFHGGSFLRVPPKGSRELVFAITHARWGGVPAASHAQLCLVGWGHNQFWEEAALGSFGESICYEPGRVQRRCFIDDIRPFMTLPAAGEKPYGWAQNAGGGDFLMWIDSEGRYRGFRATRTDWRAHGPCLTDVAYAEETLGGEIDARMEVSIPRSDDYLRVFHRFRYEVRKPVKWQRLAFCQVGADFYNEVPSRHVAIGNVAGLREAWRPPLTNRVFDRRSVPLTGAQPWVSIHGLDRAALREGQASASRGLIVRSWRASFGGRTNSLPHVTTFATEWGRENYKTVVELAPPPDVNELLPGDFIEGEVEWVVFPSDPSTYYGPSHSFRRALNLHADTWHLVDEEARGNHLEVAAKTGGVTRCYPVRVAVGKDQRAELMLRGGLGYVPVTFAGLTSYRGYELRVDSRPLDQSVHGNDFWQTDYDELTGTWSMTFNVPRAGGSCLLQLGRAGQP